jgi:pimeloyl-ACP methyl ester carboxylesterase
MPRLKSAGVEIAFDDEGEGEAILLIHGFGSNATVNWRDTGWIKLLVGEGFRVVSVDNRGHGRSGAPHDVASYSIALMAADAMGLLDHLGILQANVMGYSMGASISTWLAINQPERVSRLILGGLAYNVIRGVGGYEELALGLEADVLPSDASAKARAYRHFAEQTRSDRKALAACMRGIRQPINEQEFAGISCPILVVSGELDDVAGPVEKLTSLNRLARGVVLPGRNHMNAVGDRGYKQAVIEFLKLG